VSDITRPLAGTRVVEVAEGIAGGYCGKLLVDLGAEVVKVEAPTGDPLRQRPGVDGSFEPRGSGGLFRYLHEGKRSIALDLASETDAATFDALVAGADVVVGTVPSRVCPWDAEWRARVRKSNPLGRLVLISAYGIDGPSAGRPASDLTLQARVGSLDFRRSYTGRPTAAGGELSAWAGGTWAAIAAVLPVGREGDEIDVSLLEAAAHTLDQFSAVERSFRRGTSPQPNWPVMPSPVQTTDGWVNFHVATPQQWAAFAAMVGAEDALRDPILATLSGRIANRDRMLPVQEATAAWACTQTVQEVLNEAAARRIPAAPLATGETVTAIDHIVARGIYRPSADGETVQPRSPFLFDGERCGSPGRPPSLDEHRQELGHGWPDAPCRASSVPGNGVLPPEERLGGLRVLEFGSFWAGPVMTAVLGALGAEVVKVESVQRMDLMRLVSVAPTSEPQWFERSPMFANLNLNKRGITLNLGDPRGRELATKLVQWADVVVDSFSPRVLEGHGFDRESVLAMNPCAIFVRQPAFGLTGPWRDRGAFAPSLESVSGLTWVTGYADEPPRNPYGPCDPFTGFHALVALLAELDRRARHSDRRPVHLEVSMLEVALNIAAEAIIEYGRTGLVMARDGNRSPHVAPQGLYRCGDGRDVAMTVPDDETWERLKVALAQPAWMDDGGLSRVAGRRARHDDIDNHVATWCAEGDAEDIARRLREVGVPAEIVVPLWGSAEDPQLHHRGFFEVVDHPVVGAHEYLGLPMSFPRLGKRRWFRTAAPMLGQHNADVLGELLGLGADELEELERLAVVGDHPMGFDLKKPGGG
jgi:crotonobetainyl-CoA:carnitine CoA-transferase CaiB-like acyl-CoA transferase